MTRTATLGDSAARGAAATMLGQFARVGIQVAGLVVLARLLAPADYGLLAMVLAVIGIGEIFRDFGLSAAAIQAKTLSRGERDNLFWVNTGIGFVLMILCLGASYVLPLVYDEPRLQGITAMLSVTFLFNGMSTQLRADLTRNLRFGRLALIEIVAPLLGLLIGIGAALLGATYWSLVAQQVAVPLISLVMLISVTQWLPSPPNRAVSIRHFIGFGANLLGVQLLTYASRNVDSIVVGARFGPTALGFYDRAFQLLLLPLNQINAPATRVALPVLSRLQDEPAKFDTFLLRGQSLLVHGITAVFMFAAFNAPALVEVLLGDKWLPSAILFQLLAIGGIAQGLSYATYWVFLAFGLTASNLRYALATRPILVGAVLVGAAWGPNGVALGYSLTLLAFWPFGLWWISRVSRAPAWSMFLAGARAASGYLICGVVSGQIAHWIDFSAPLELVIGAAAFTAVFAGVVLVWPAFRADVRALLQLRSAFRREK